MNIKDFKQMDIYFRASRKSAFLKILAVAILLALYSSDRAGAETPSPRGVVVGADIERARTLSQNWTDEQAQWFYNAPQGSKLIPYKWFLYLEQPESETRFRDADHVRSFGYLPRNPDTLGNPDGLPVGFVKDGEHLGFTCAACHTNQINHNGTAFLIDGAPTLADIEKFELRLHDAMDRTLNDPGKFARFISTQLPANAVQADKDELADRLRKEVQFRKDFNHRNLSRGGSPPFGPGRIDAFGVILNEVTSTFAQRPDNHFPANAPVSYPFLWDTPQHNRVQWNGAAENSEDSILGLAVGTSHVGALGRNAGEVMGVFGRVDATTPGGVTQLFGYPSSINRQDLIRLEEELWSLWSPEWPSEFPSIKPALRDKGEQLYRANCITCHALIDRKAQGRKITAQMELVGTDQTMAKNFATRRANSGVFKDRRISLTRTAKFGQTANVKDMLVHIVQRVLIFPDSTMGPSSTEAARQMTEEQIAKVQPLEYKIFAGLRTSPDTLLFGAFDTLTLDNDKVKEATTREPLKLVEEGQFNLQDGLPSPTTQRFMAISEAPNESLQEVRQSFGANGTIASFDQPVAIEFAYKARPLNGIWATAPYLHNGSIPNLKELLKQPEMRSQSNFWVGGREFDTANVGFKIDAGKSEFDPRIPGNSNAGHGYRQAFTDAERDQLLEFLKSL